MKTRPILFKAPMVRAILAGRKNQTRRLVKWPVLTRSDGAKQRLLYECDVAVINQMLAEKARHPLRRPKSPYGVAGDGLYVKETWSHDADSIEQCRREHEDALGGNGHGPYYLATEVAPETLRWKPSIHMPRWASRITLRVTDVRVERLQDITEEDAKAEGVGLVLADEMGPLKEAMTRAVSKSRRAGFRLLWDSINGPGAWDANPWVWRVGFERVAP